MRKRKVFSQTPMNSLAVETLTGDEQVMSEVFVGCPPSFSGPHISYLAVFIPRDIRDRRCSDLFRCEEDLMFQPKTISLDKDGDLVLTRRCDIPACSATLIIQHNITSSIQCAGLQVWKAELLLSDFVLHKIFTSHEFDGIIAVELGAGTGLAGILLAHVAKSVFLTDHIGEVLDNCARNVDLNLNSRVLNHSAAVHVRRLDWRSSWPPPTATVINSEPARRHFWISSDVEEAEAASILLAADVIYSDDITDCLFETLERLMPPGSPKILYLALEKRYNFTIDDRDVVAHGYSHFRSHLLEEEEGGEDGEGTCFIGRQVDVSMVHQYLCDYDRCGSDLELWQIKHQNLATPSLRTS